jgi:hypothetical protein
MYDLEKVPATDKAINTRCRKLHPRLSGFWAVNAKFTGINMGGS